MTFLAACTVIGLGILAAKTCSRWLDRRAHARSAETHALIRREPSRALAAYDDRDTWRQADAAYVPPGSLGPHPETMPGPYGRLPRRIRRRHVDRLVREIETQQRARRAG